MKKSFILLILAGLFFTSCATLPKKVTPNETLLTGCIKATAHGYATYGTSSVNNSKSTKIEITMSDSKDMKVYKIKPNKDGLFVIKGLSAGETYRIRNLKLISEGGDGSSAWVFVNFQNHKPITMDSEAITNIGYIAIDFDGKTNYTTWTIDRHYYVEDKFKALAEEEDSEWAYKRFNRVYNAF